MRDLLIDKNKQELKQHGNVEFPFRIGYEDIWQYYNGKFACHWHKEVEFTYVYQGKMRYQVNDKIYELKPGQNPLGFIEILDNKYLASLNN